MMKIAHDVIGCLRGRTLATAESLTGGMIGAVLTAVPGASEVYKGGIISYTDEIKQQLLGVPAELLLQQGAVSAPVAMAMAAGVRARLHANVAIAVTGLAGPGGDDFGHPVGTVFIALADTETTLVRECHFAGDRDAVRRSTAVTALKWILEREASYVQ